MFDIAIQENAGTLKPVPDCYKNQKMFNKAVDNYLHALEFVSEFYSTQEMCNRAVNRCFFVSDSTPDQFKTQEMCGRVVSEDPFLYYIGLINIKLKKMFYKATDYSLAALKPNPH